MDAFSTSEMQFLHPQTSVNDSFSQPPLQIDDFGITAENVDLLAAELDVELLKDFFGSSLGEDIVKYARADDSPSEASSSTSPPSSGFPSPPATTSSTSPSPSTPPTSENCRKRKATQDRFCVNCQTHESSMWRRDPEGNSLCNACGQHFKKFKVHRPASMFGRQIKRRCRKVKPDQTSPPSTTLLSPNGHFNFGMVHFQEQTQQIPPPHHFHQPQPIPPQYSMQAFQQPPPEAYFSYRNWQLHPSYPNPLFFQPGQW
uniref:GATA-type domain-containing protein n=1 Tax=Panagrellus redivivus TaxID=6233 RepID=A0A7E4ZXK5_PANRE